MLFKYVDWFFFFNIPRKQYKRNCSQEVATQCGWSPWGQLWVCQVRAGAGQNLQKMHFSLHFISLLLTQIHRVLLSSPSKPQHKVKDCGELHKLPGGLTCPLCHLESSQRSGRPSLPVWNTTSRKTTHLRLSNTPRMATSLLLPMLFERASELNFPPRPSSRPSMHRWKPQARQALQVKQTARPFILRSVIQSGYALTYQNDRKGSQGILMGNPWAEAWLGPSVTQRGKSSGRNVTHVALEIQLLGRPWLKCMEALGCH